LLSTQHEDFLKYRIARARSNPTKEEIEEHMMRHDELMHQKNMAKYGDDRRVLKNGVNNEPFDLLFKKAQFLAAEDSRDSTFDRRGPSKQQPQSLLKTKFNARVIESIEREKDTEFLAAEEKRARLQRKKEFSDQVRETFLPPAPTPLKGALRNNSDPSNFNSPDRSKRTVNFAVDENFHYGSGGSPKRPGGGGGGGRGHRGRRGGGGGGGGGDDLFLDEVSLDDSMLVVPKVRFRGGLTGPVTSSSGGKPSMGKTVDMSPRSNKSGPMYIAEVIESDADERYLADVYESGFTQFFKESKIVAARVKEGANRRGNVMFDDDGEA